ncbi:MAG: hypothetical protein R6U99_00255, partial [Nioella sp.]
MAGPRDGEVVLPFDPGQRAVDGVTFIGRIRSPWVAGAAPRNLVQARESGQRKVKNIQTGAIREETFNPNDKFPKAHIETKEM